MLLVALSNDCILISEIRKEILNFLNVTRVVGDINFYYLFQKIINPNCSIYIFSQCPIKYSHQEHRHPFMQLFHWLQNGSKIRKLIFPPAGHRYAVPIASTLRQHI